MVDTTSLSIDLVHVIRTAGCLAEIFDLMTGTTDVNIPSVQGRKMKIIINYITYAI